MPLPESLARAILNRRVAAPLEDYTARAMPTRGQQRLEDAVYRGPRGEVYTFPQDVMLRDRTAWAAMRKMIDKGLYDPAELAFKETGDPKARSVMRLSDTMQSVGLPRLKSIGPQFDAMAFKLDPTESVTHAAAALSGPQLTKANVAYLNDLAASVAPEAKGSGGELLQAILEGPLYPDAPQMMFTPLEGARPWYEKKFGMEYVPWKEAKTDDAMRSVLQNLGMEHNAIDLGVGIIKRAEGGLAAYHRSNHHG